MENSHVNQKVAIIFGEQSANIKVYLFLKKIVFYIFKYIGAFWIARHFTKKYLRIVSYHGFSKDDEAEFSPRTFIKKETFNKRMEFLHNKGFPVLQLGEALTLLHSNKIPPCSIVITIDDGFYRTYSDAWPVLQKYNFPATIYIATYYVIKESPVFDLIIEYMFWKTKKLRLIFME